METPTRDGQMQSQQQHVYSKAHADLLDQQDPLHHLSSEFCIPSKADLKAQTFDQVWKPRDPSSSPAADHDSSNVLSVYLCGNSLGVQPRLTSTRLQQYLTTWATQGVFGHFKPLAQSPLPPWLHVDSRASDDIFSIVGALPAEVAVMETLTANLHLLMCAFYKPDIHHRHKIILESKAFPSDHYAVESQILHHGLSPGTSMVTMEPPDQSSPTMTTAHILSVIAEHASTTAILLLPGIQFYTGQLFDIPTITKAARDAGIFVIWDLAHCVGNVALNLHDWDVDAAAWCSYKYLNAGPGSIGGLFIHERHSRVSSSSESGGEWAAGFANRLSGWWGSDKESRFAMENRFVPIPGAAGFQLSNPSVLDITSLNASLEVFKKAGGMAPLRQKSLKLTTYLETLLLISPHFGSSFHIITPRDPEQRGAQLSVKLEAGLLDVVIRELEERGVIVDERRPDVIRVAPAPLYNTFNDVYEFRRAFDEALDVAQKTMAGVVEAEGTSELEKTT